MWSRGNIDILDFSPFENRKRWLYVLKHGKLVCKTITWRRRIYPQIQFPWWHRRDWTPPNGIGQDRLWDLSSHHWFMLRKYKSLSSILRRPSHVHFLPRFFESLGMADVAAFSQIVLNDTWVSFASVSSIPQFLSNVAWVQLILELWSLDGEHSWYPCINVPRLTTSQPFWRSSIFHPPFL